MTKLLLPCLLVLIVVSCNKKKNDPEHIVFNRDYHVFYYQHGDSFVAYGNFHRLSDGSTPGLFGGAEVTFNGRERDYMNGLYHYWKGKGKPEANFALIQGETHIVDVLPLSEMGDYQLIYPDTISRSEKLTLKITGTGAMHSVSKGVGITAINGYESSVRVDGDSCVFYKGTLSGCNTGPATLRFNVKVQKGSPMDSSR